MQDAEADDSIDDDNQSQLSVTSIKANKVTERYQRIISKKKIKAEDAILQDPNSTLKAMAGTATCTSANAKEEDDDDIDGNYVATEMRRINDPGAKQWLKFKFQGLLFEAQYGGGSSYACTSQSVHYTTS